MLQRLGAIESSLSALVDWVFPSTDLTPTLLTAPHERAEHRQDLQTLARELYDTQECIERLESQLRRIKKDVKYRTAAVSNALSPASAVPTEIARDIFMFAIDQGRDDNLQTRLAISQTCHYWRVVTLSLPEFWQSIVLNSAQAHLYETLRLRSHPLPMWLRVEDAKRPMRDGILGKPYSDEDDGLSEPMTNKFAHVQDSRLISLRIEDVARFPFAQFFGDSVLPIHMNELQLFSSRNYGHECSAMFTPRRIHARRLLFSKSWIDPLHFDVTLLVKLALVDIPYEAIGRLLTVAADCPALEILHLEGIKRASQTGPPVLLLTPWMSVDIRSLAIIGCAEELWMPLLSHPSFRLPKMISFVLHHVDHLIAAAPTPDVFRAFFMGSPYLESLNLLLDASDLPHVLVSLLSSGDSAPAPSIRSLELISQGRSDDGWLLSATVQSVIRERSVNEHVRNVEALQRLAISRYLVGELEDWYANAVEEGGLMIVEEDVGEPEMDGDMEDL
ncbi:hypothetical protein DL93DRAFT_2086061 [Clavulina sp. PMI_390]|nr:hypothetical protein DL93DRAFT_2086061 [Clavulina sp. PMI_390]